MIVVKSVPEKIHYRVLIVTIIMSI